MACPALAPYARVCITPTSMDDDETLAAQLVVAEEFACSLLSSCNDDGFQFAAAQHCEDAAEQKSTGAPPAEPVAAGRAWVSMRRGTRWLYAMVHVQTVFALRFVMHLWCCQAQEMPQRRELFSRRHARRKVQRCLRHWRQMTSCGVSLLSMSSCETPCRKATTLLTWPRVALRALARLRDLARAGRRDRERLRLARWHLRRARLGTAFVRLKVFISSDRRLARTAALRANTLAAKFYASALCSRSFGLWQAGLAVPLRTALRCFVAAALRRWAKLAPLLRAAQAALESRVVEEDFHNRPWRRSRARLAWHALRTHAAWQISVRAALAKSRCRQRLLLAMMLWRVHAPVLRRAREFFCHRRDASMESSLHAWHLAALEDQERRHRAEALGRALCLARHTRVLQRWCQCMTVQVALREFKERERRRLQVRAFAALDDHRRRMDAREQQRRRVTRWRYLRLLSYTLSAFREEVALKAIHECLAAAAQLRRAPRVAGSCFQCWIAEVLPVMQVEARRRRGATMQRCVFRALSCVTARRRIKCQDGVRAKQVVARCVLELAWRRLSSTLRLRLEHRRSLRSLALVSRAMSESRARRRVLYTWGVVYAPSRRRARRRYELAILLRSERLCRAVVWGLLWRLRRRRELADRSGPFILRLQRARERQWLQCWQLVAAEQLCSRRQREEALLQWYVVLCSSSISVWRRFLEDRRRRKRRQAHAKELFIVSQRNAALRALVWRFHERRVAEEEAAAQRIAREHQRRIERASFAARRWRTFTRERACLGGCDATFPCGDSTVCPVSPWESPGDPDDNLDEDRWVLDALPTRATASTSAWTTSQTFPEDLRNSWTPSLSDSWQ